MVYRRYRRRTYRRPYRRPVIRRRYGRGARYVYRDVVPFNTCVSKPGELDACAAVDFSLKKILDGLNKDYSFLAAAAGHRYFKLSKVYVRPVVSNASCEAKQFQGVNAKKEDVYGYAHVPLNRKDNIFKWVWDHRGELIPTQKFYEYDPVPNTRGHYVGRGPVLGLHLKGPYADSIQKMATFYDQCKNDWTNAVANLGWYAKSSSKENANDRTLTYKEINAKIVLFVLGTMKSCLIEWFLNVHGMLKVTCVFKFRVRRRRGIDIKPGGVAIGFSKESQNEAYTKEEIFVTQKDPLDLKDLVPDPTSCRIQLDPVFDDGAGVVCDKEFAYTMPTLRLPIEPFYDDGREEPSVARKRNEREPLK